MKKFLKWGIVVVVVLGIIGSLMGGEDSTDTSTNNASKGTKQEETQSAKEEKKAFKIGDEVKVDKLTYKVEGTEIKKKIGDEYLNTEAQGEYLILKISVTNNDKEARILDTTLFQLVDKEGTTYEPDAEADTYLNGDNMFFLDEVNPKITKTGYVAFDLADPKIEYTLKVTGGMVSSAEETINLK